ncbi:MAG: hypothetical protein ACI80V_002586 [Rhodothermales bacterium]|jgi:hypothetical protein
MTASVESIVELLGDPDAEEASWSRVCGWAEERYGRDPSVESLLFLIGIHSRDGDFSVRLKKEMKQDLIMEGTYLVLSTIGVYRRREAEPEPGESGWERVKTVPVLSESDQERLLRIAIARYLAQTLQLGS